MKRKWIETGQDLLIILLNHFVMIALGMTAMGLFRQEEHHVWLWSVLLVIPLLFYGARIKIWNFFLFFVLHLIVSVGIFFLPISKVPKFLMLFISVVYVIWSIRIRIKGGKHGEGLLAPIFMVAALGGMLLVETSYSHKGWEGIYVAMAIFYTAGYCMHLFTSRYLRFLVVNESSAANIPEGEIFYNGLRQTFLYVGGVVTFLVLTAKMEGLSYIVSRIVSWFGSLLGSLFRKLFVFVFMEDDNTEKMPAIMLEEEEALLDLGMLEEAGESLLDLEMLEELEEMTSNWVVLEKPVMIGVNLFLVGLVVFGIVKGFQYLWKGFHKDVSKDEGKNTNSIDIRENCTIEKNKKEGINRFLFLNNGEKIRKIYRTQVLKNRTALIGDLDAEYLEYMTAKECCDKFAAAQLKKMYEKARYSSEEIISDDVRAAKSGGQ